MELCYTQAIVYSVLRHFPLPRRFPQAYGYRFDVEPIPIFFYFFTVCIVFLGKLHLYKGMICVAGRLQVPPSLEKGEI